MATARVMATAALLLLAMFAFAVEGQTKSFPVMYKDFMEAKNGKAKIASEHSYGYEQSELQGACLRLLNKKNCADEDDNEGKGKGTKRVKAKGDDDIHLYLETDVGCCREGYSTKHQDVFRLPEDLKVGSCWWTYLMVADGEPDGASAKLIGTFDVTCEMEEESEKCGEPLCDDLIIHGWGRLYKDWNAAIEGQPDIDNECSLRAAPAPPPKAEALAPAAPVGKTNPAHVASANSYYEKEEPEYWKGKAIIADGYVNLMSCSKKTVYKEGKMQAVIDYYIYDDDRRSQNGGDTPKPIKPSPDQFIAKPYQMDLILRKTGDY